MKTLFFISSALLFIIFQTGECRESAAAPANFADYPYVVYVYVDGWKEHFVGLALSRRFILGSIWWSEAQFTDEFEVYAGDPSSSNRKVRVGGGDDRNLVVLKACGFLSPSAKGMSLSPSDFPSFDTDSPAKLLFFSPQKQLMYVNTTVLSDTNCPTALASGSINNGHAFDAAEETCTQPDDTTGSCEWYSDGSSYWSPSVLLVGEQPVGVMQADACDTSSLPATLQGSTVYTKILPNRDFIISYTNGDVDQP